jgi:hypothetical protein
MSSPTVVPTPAWWMAARQQAATRDSAAKVVLKILGSTGSSTALGVGPVSASARWPRLVTASAAWR